jgi:Mg-chelatase subunit ChlD
MATPCQLPYDPEYRKCNIVLVLDASGSMKNPEGDSKLSKMNKGLHKFIKYTLHNKANLGVVGFNNDGRTVCSMREIGDETSRNEIVEQCLLTEVYGWTSIGNGLLQGIKVLGGPKKSAGGRIILLTDGEQNKNPKADSAVVREALEKSKVIVDTISLTAKADSVMVNLAEKYQGRWSP